MIKIVWHVILFKNKKSDLLHGDQHSTLKDGVDVYYAPRALRTKAQTQSKRVIYFTR